MLPEQLAEIPDDTSVACCPERNEQCTVLPIAVMVIGLGLMVVGFSIPRNYVFDPDAPAREMEAIENFYIKLGYNLDICITVGMGLVALGSIMASVVMLHDAFCGNEELDEDSMSNDFLMTRYYSSYGAASTESGQEHSNQSTQ